MKKIKLNITDERMLLAPEKLKAMGIIRFRQEFTDRIDLAKQNVRRIRLGKQHFTGAQIAAACREFGINANWITGLEGNFMRLDKNIHPLQKTG